MKRSLRDPEEFSACAMVVVFIVGSVAIGLLIGMLLEATAKYRLGF